ncbi:hypothetical protein TNCV_1398771 [Trichonephila clavipes]|nr:hypothetical protein TNCV_1398771 [Trichonephila clavipes]
MKASVLETYQKKNPVPRGRAGGKGGEPNRAAGKRRQRSEEGETVRPNGCKTTEASEKRGRWRELGGSEIK